MFVSTTVVSTRIRRPSTIPRSRANSISRWCKFRITSGPITCPSRAKVFAYRHFLIADPREGPIDQIRAHFPLQRVVTPVPHMLQDQQPQRHFGGCLCPPARPALRMPLPLRFIHALHQSRILQQTNCLPHPGFPQILDVFRQSRVPQTRPLVPLKDYSIASVTKFASDTHRHLLPRTQPPSHTKHTSFFTIFATESS